MPSIVGMTDVELFWPLETRLIKPGIRSTRTVTMISSHPPPAAVDLLRPCWDKVPDTWTGFCMTLQKALTLEVYFMLFQKALCCLCRPYGFDPRESVFADVVLLQNSWVIHHFLLASSFLSQDHWGRWSPSQQSSGSFQLHCGGKLAETEIFNFY